MRFCGKSAVSEKRMLSQRKKGVKSMKYIVEPKMASELAFCNGCKSNACNTYSHSSGNTDVKVNVTVKV